MTLQELETAIRAAHASAPMDKEIIGTAIASEDADADYLQGRDYYAWLWAAASVTRPHSVAEIGVRLGYSAIAMLRGAGDACQRYIGWDAEAYIAGSNVRAEASIRAAFGNVSIELVTANTQALGTLGGDLDFPSATVFFVDGDHSYGGALHDLRLAYGAVPPGGIILFDDVDMSSECRRAGDVFIREKGLESFYLPTFRGLYVMRRNHER